MNPFLDPTVAVPQPDAQWHEQAPVPRLAPNSRFRPGVRAPRPRARACRLPHRPSDTAPSGRVGRMLGVLSLAGAMLCLPGVALAIDINSANLEQLQEVKGIGPKMARVILDERERGGRYESLGDVSERVKGIGPKKAASLQAAGLTVGTAAKGVPTPAGARNTAPESARRGR